MSRVCLIAVVLAALSACSGSGTAGPPAGAARSSVPAAGPAPTTTTTAPIPVLGGTSPDDTAGHLLAAWKAGDRRAARTEADPAAVDAVFAQPYPAGGLQSRGCDQNPTASSCFYRVGDGGLSIHTVHTPVGWRVDSAQFEQ